MIIYFLRTLLSFFYGPDFFLPNHCRCRSIVAPDHTQWNTQHLTTHNTYKRQSFMPPSRFESTIPASERPQTHALDRAATGISFLQTFVTRFLCLRPRSSLNAVVPKRAPRISRGPLPFPVDAWIQFCTVIPRLTKIIRSGITFVSRNSSLSRT